MKLLKFRVLFFKVPSTPSGGDVDLINEGVGFQKAQLNLRHGNLHDIPLTLIVEY